MKRKSIVTEPELSHPLAVDKIPPSGQIATLEANAAQRTALSERFGLVELPKFGAEFHVKPSDSGKSFSVVGKVNADVVQRCVVTLEPLPSHVECDVDTVFALSVPNEPEDFDSGEGETEIIVNGLIDLGELAAQHLAVALDPYPRKPGVAFVAAEYGDSQKEGNPFIRLAELSKKPKNRE